MSKIIAVTGATGAQGGSVCKIMGKAGWKVRAITRNPDGEKGKALTAEGHEVVQANIDDIDSLKKVFEVRRFPYKRLGRSQASPNPKTGALRLDRERLITSGTNADTHVVHRERLQYLP